ncbi:hypothetical protein F4777DRAFT_479088 [Nemania sp. FL0916]|nr:hypothetical protein F4777DRAFT_479088 [Nemania sp. FL0916]
MIIINCVFLLLLIAISPHSSDAATNSSSAYRNTNITTRTLTRGIGVYGEGGKVIEGRNVEKNALLTTLQSFSPTQGADPVIIRGKENWKTEPYDYTRLKGWCGNWPYCVTFTNELLASSCSMPSPKTIIPPAVTTTVTAPASLDTEAPTTVRTGTYASVIHTAESTLSMDTAGSITCVAVVTGNSSQISHSSSLRMGQLAGIVVAVFLISSILSSLATVFFLRRRRQTKSAMSTHKSWLTSNIPRGQTFPSADVTNTQQNASGDRGPALPSQTRQTMPSGNRISSISSGAISEHIYPVSPLSDQTSYNTVQGNLGPMLYENGTQHASRSGTSNISPVRFSIARRPTQIRPQQLQAVREWTQENHAQQPQAGVQIAESFPPAYEFTASNRGPGIGGYNNGAEVRSVATERTDNLDTLAPSSVPLHFGNLGAYNSFPTQKSMDFREDDRTFLLPTNDQLVDRNPSPSPTESRPQSPSHSTIISQDLTQFDPGGHGQQPSTFMDPMPFVPLSLDYSDLPALPVFQKEPSEASVQRPPP